MDKSSGVKAEDLTREELLHVINWLLREKSDLQTRLSAATDKHMSDLVRIGPANQRLFEACQEAHTALTNALAVAKEKI